MKTERMPTQLEFHGFGKREVEGRFDAGQISTDGGGLLVREVNRRPGLLKRLAGQFTDLRDESRIEHSVAELVSQRVMALTLGYEDLNGHDQLCRDSVLALMVGKSDPKGQDRERKQDRGKPLASSSTLNLLEFSEPGATSTERHKKIVADTDGMDRLLVELFVESYKKPPKRI